MDRKVRSLMGNPIQETSQQPPAAKALPSRWIPDHDDKPRVNVSYQKVPRQFIKRPTRTPKLKTLS